MRHEDPAKPRRVIGPEGRPLALDDLPPTDIKRWSMRRKAEVVLAVHGGLITPSTACERYRMSIEELWSWDRLLDRHGLPGLRVTRLQEYRRPTQVNGNGMTSSGLRSERGPTDRTTQHPKQDGVLAPAYDGTVRR